MTDEKTVSFPLRPPQQIVGRGRFADRTLLRQLGQQVDRTRPGRAAERGVAHRDDLVAQERAAVAVDPVGHALFFGEAKRVRVGKVAVPVGVAQRTQQEGRVLLGGDRIVCAVLRAAHARRQTVPVQPADVGLGPVGHIGEGRVVGRCFGLGLPAQQAHQHHARFSAGGGAVKLIALVRACEQPHRLHAVGAVGEIRGICRRGQRGGQRARHEHAKKSFHAKNLLWDTFIVS